MERSRKSLKSGLMAKTFVSYPQINTKPGKDLVSLL